MGALLAGHAEREEEPALPSWAEEAITPDSDTARLYTTGVPVLARIREVTHLPENRTRLILDAVRPMGSIPPDGSAAPQAACPNPASPLPGGLVLTWQSPDFAATGYPAPGRDFSGVLRIRAVHAMANPGVWETEQYWRDRNVYFRAWISGDGSRKQAAPARVYGKSAFGEDTRIALQERVHAVLAGGALPDGTGSVDSPASLAPVSPLSRGRAVIPALLFGDRSGLDRHSQNLVAKGTLAHSLALSGMHLAFAAALGYGFAALLGRLFPRLYLAIPRQKLGIALAIPPALAYLWLGGAPPSLLRAALMLLFWGYLAWRGKPKALQDGLLWALLLILTVSPLSLYDIRLQLSALAVGTIDLVLPLLDGWLDRIARWNRSCGPILRYFLPYALFSLAIQITLLPLTITAFNETGLLFPLNFIWLPVLGLFIMPLSFAGLALTALAGAIDIPAVTHAADVCFNLATLPCELLFTLLERLDSLGLLASPVALRPAWLACFGFWLLLLCLPRFMAMLREKAPSPHGLILAGCAFCLMLLPEAGRLIEEQRDTVALRLLDVGQGQAVLLEWKGGGRALIDGGGFTGNFDVGKNIITPALTDNRPPHIDWLINSHPDTDHLGGLLYPAATFRVEHFAHNAEHAKETLLTLERDALFRQKRIRPEVLFAGDSVHLSPDLTLEILYPPRDDGKRPLSGNNAALALRILWRGRPLAILCGDLEKPALRRLREANRPLAADVLVLPHHGSAGSLDPEFYSLVDPKLALVSCGYGNQWHFPAQSVREALAAQGVPLESTAERGQIMLVWENPETFSIRYARPVEKGQ